MENFDFVIAGGGVFGITAGLELIKRKYKVAVLNPNSLPHHLAASTDISKAVRMEYGSDSLYFDMAEKSIAGWKRWNHVLGKEIYQEVGFLMLSKYPFEHKRQQYEYHSYHQLLSHGYHPERIAREELADRFPAFNSKVYVEASFNKIGGYVKSALAIQLLIGYAISLGLKVYEGHTVSGFRIKNGKVHAVRTREGITFNCGNAIIAAGANSPSLIPSLKPFIKISGHPVFWLKPNKPELFSAARFPVFMADISNTGWYGFPFSADEGVVKIARHSQGLIKDPSLDDRIVLNEDTQHLRQFLRESLPELSHAPIVYTRCCLYTDTLDGHFWIDHHPEIEGLSISTGGSGHAMKMAPVLGKVTADMLEGKSNEYLHRFRWRKMNQNISQSEESRFLQNRNI